MRVPGGLDADKMSQKTFSDSPELVSFKKKLSLFVGRIQEFKDEIVLKS